MPILPALGGEGKMGGHTKTLSQKKRKRTRISYNWTAVAEQWQKYKGAKVRGLKELCPSQLVAVTLNTSNKGPCGGRRGKGAVTASRGSNTFHCPLVPTGGRIRQQTVLTIMVKQAGTQTAPSLLYCQLQQKDLGKPSWPRLSPSRGPQDRDGDKYFQVFSSLLANRVKGKDKLQQLVLSPRVEGNQDREEENGDRAAMPRQHRPMTPAGRKQGQGDHPKFKASQVYTGPGQKDPISKIIITNKDKNNVKE